MSFRKEYDSKRPRQSAWQKWLPVVGLIIIVGFFGSVMWSTGSYSNAAIINQYFLPTQMDPSNHEKPEALSHDLRIKKEEQLEHQYWSGELFYKKRDFPKAIEAYDFVLKNRNDTTYTVENVNFDIAKWNQTLMFLGNKEREKAIEELGKIAISDMPEKYKKDAVELKQKLNSFWYGWAN